MFSLSVLTTSLLLEGCLHLWILLLPVNLVAIFTVSNPVWAILLLVLVFIGNSLLFLSYNAAYLGLIFIIVYIGAIAILFLFVIMLVNLRVVYTFYKTFSFVFCLLLAFFFFSDLVLTQNYFFTGDMFRITDMSLLDFAVDPFYRFMFFSDALQPLGFIFYNNYAYYVVILGLLLLVILVGVVLLLRPVIIKSLMVDRSSVSSTSLKNKALQPLLKTVLRSRS